MIGDVKAVAPAGMLADTTLWTSLLFQVIVSPTLIVPRSWGVNRFWPAGMLTVRGVAAAGGTVGTTVGTAVGTTVGSTVGTTVGTGAPGTATTVNCPTIWVGLWVA